MLRNISPLFHRLNTEQNLCWFCLLVPNYTLLSKILFVCFVIKGVNRCFADLLPLLVFQPHQTAHFWSLSKTRVFIALSVPLLMLFLLPRMSFLSPTQSSNPKPNLLLTLSSEFLKHSKYNLPNYMRDTVSSLSQPADNNC